MGYNDVRYRSSILKAVEEYNSLGQEKFLQKYRFGKARNYFLEVNGVYYDSKAIVGVAHKYEFPDKGPLKSDDFSGGEKTVMRKRETLQFNVVVQRPQQPPRPFVLPEEVEASECYTEGTSRQVSVNAFERNNAVRSACIEYWGANCQICGFSFGETYGETGLGYIHVHHLKPLAEVRATHDVNPIKDLCPVCPNCHAIIHLRKPSYSPEEIRAMLDKSRESN